VDAAHPLPRLPWCLLPRLGWTEEEEKVVVVVMVMVSTFVRRMAMTHPVTPNRHPYPSSFLGA